MQDAENQDVTEKEEIQEQTQQGLTREEISLFIQAETNKAISAFKDEQQKQQKKEQQKQKPLSQMDEASRNEAEKEEEIEDLKEQLAKYKLANTKAEVSKVLANRDIDPNFVDFIVLDDDIEENIKRVDTFDKLLKNVLKKDRAVYLRGTPSKNTQTAFSNGLSKEDFKKMSIQQLQGLYEQDKNLYFELTQQ